MWASWPLARSVVLDAACSAVAASTFGAARFTAEIEWPLAVIAFGIFTFRAKPSFSPLVTVSGNAPELAVAVPAEPATCSNPEQPSNFATSFAMPPIFGLRRWRAGRSQSRRANPGVVQRSLQSRGSVLPRFPDDWLPGSHEPGPVVRCLRRPTCNVR